MNIIYKPNPLATIIELDESDKLLLRERIKSNDLEERIGSANFALDQEQQQWANKHLKPKTLAEFVDEAIDRLDYDFIVGDANEDGQTYDQWLDKRLELAIQELQNSHNGDCTCVAVSCFKCHVESLLGIDTIKGLGSHEASRIDGAFANNATIDEAIEKLRNYHPTKTTEWDKYPGAFEKHIQRWTEEAKNASEWLVKYKEERSL